MVTAIEPQTGCAARVDAGLADDHLVQWLPAEADEPLSALLYPCLASSMKPADSRRINGG